MFLTALIQQEVITVTKLLRSTCNEDVFITKEVLKACDLWQETGLQFITNTHKTTPNE